jgi:hypothetical protein
MQTLIVDSSTVQAQNFINFAKTLSFVKIDVAPLEQPKKNIYEAVAESNATTVDAFFDEVDNRIKKRFGNV